MYASAEKADAVNPTLLRCIDHLVPEFYEGELTGAVCIGGEDIFEMSVGEVSR